MKRVKPTHIILGITAVVVAIFLLPQVLADQPGARNVQGDVITETIGVVETDATAVFTIQLFEGAGAEHESQHVFESLAGLVGVGKASLDAQSLELTVAYDSQAISEDPIRLRLVDAGYLAVSLDDATPTEMAEDGTVQRIAISDDGVRFDPYLVIATAGVPIEMDFAPGQECRVGIKIPALGVEQDIAAGGQVKLPALAPGTYDILCSGDGQEATIVVE